MLMKVEAEAEAEVEMILRKINLGVVVQKLACQERVTISHRKDK